MKLERKAKRIIAIGGGKGGVGKSIVSTALACHWARQQRRVVLIDLDLGAANLHSYLGIRRQTPTLADFLRRKTDSLEPLLIPTGLPHLRLCSGAESFPGMANPPHWLKQKLLRHIRALDADVVVLDLGAGVAFNTLDFFDAADDGVIVTEPEPAAVMNAYGFIKSALLRTLQSVFRHHETLGEALEADLALPEDRRAFSLDWLRQQARAQAPDAVALIDEVQQAFRPALLVNRHSAQASPVLIDNLRMLCRQKLGVELDWLGHLPDMPDLRRSLLNVPGFLDSPSGSPLRKAVAAAAQPLETHFPPEAPPRDYSDDDVQALLNMVDWLDDHALGGRPRDAWKLRVYFRPEEVDAHLRRHGSGLAA